MVWLDALGVPPDSIFWNHGIRQGKIPKWLSEEAVAETKRQIAELGPRPGVLFFQPGARYTWLKETWLPFLLAKREEIAKTQAGNLLKVDLEAMAEANQESIEAKLKDLKKNTSLDEPPEQFFTRARALRKRAREVLQPPWRTKTQSLKWVPKGIVNAVEGTSVPEAVEMSQERSLDSGENRAFSSTSVAGLSPEGE